MGIVCIVEQSFLISLKTKQETGIVVLGANKKMLPEKKVKFHVQGTNAFLLRHTSPLLNLKQTSISSLHVH